MIAPITSVHNASIKHLVKLQQKKHRLQHQQFVAEGLHTCLTVMEKLTPTMIYTTKPFLHEHTDQLKNLPITLVSSTVMNKISTATTPSGMIGLFATPQPTLEPATAQSIALINIQDPGNLGTLIRSAAAMNIKNIYLIDGVDPYNPKVIQSTAGTIAWVTLISTSWPEFKVHTKNLSTCALVVKNGIPPEQLNLKKMIPVVGNESQGLPQSIIDDCNYRMTLAMPGNTESLNASVAGSIALYVKMQQSL